MADDGFMRGTNRAMDELHDTIRRLENERSVLEKLVAKQPSFESCLTLQHNREMAEQQIIEEALKDSEQQYRLLAESAEDFIFIVDRAYAVRYVNGFGAKVFRCAPLDIIGKPLDMLFSPEQYKQIKASLDIVLKTGQSQSKESRIDFPSQKGIWLETKLIPMHVKAQSVETVLGIARDITVRKEVEENLFKNEEKFRTLSETITAGIAIIKNGKISYANKYLLENAEYTLDELRSKHFWEIVHPDYQQIVRKRQDTRLKGEQVDSTIEFKVILKSGKELWLHQNAGTIVFDGEPATLITVWDITEQKKIEQALAAEKERLDVTLSSIGDSVISTDTHTNIVTINKMAELLTGYTRDEAVGRPLDYICRMIDPKTHLVRQGIFLAMIGQHGIVPFKKHVRMLSSDQTEHQIDMSVAPIRSDDGTVIGIVLVFRDISERQKLETELFKARKLESLGVLAGGIAHDFNNILTGIITNLFMAKISMPPASESYKLLVDAEKACFRASRLTKQLLTFSKGGSPVKEVASVKELIEETVGFCLSGSNANYHLDLPDDLLAANIDKGQIDQVINNLLINSLQAMPAGGTITVTAANVTIDASAREVETPGALRPGNYIKISIIDEGVGIAPKDLEKIFDPYFTTKPQGTGLGLTTSYSIIKNHDGIITVESRPGKGSVFSFYLPALEISIGSHTVEEKLVKHGGGKILVMDDDDAVRTVISQLLKGFGYTVLCTATGNETIDTYKSALNESQPFDVVIMDLTIPGGIGGKEVVKILAGIDPTVKAIVASGYSNDPVMANFKDYGFCGVILKPFNIDEFVRVVEGAMNI